tara:strand:- start:81 stop:1385 length:1305 start_codon:yes stop_codon:yes gene_type:complete
MESKKKSKKIEKNSILIFSISFFLVFYYFYGFFTDENSSGAGGYDADFSLIWSNLNLLKDGIFNNLNNPNYSDSRPPLSYILHIFFNPFIHDQEAFRLSALLISLIVPILIFFSIKENYSKMDIKVCLLLALIITLSPYFRTTAFWALGENYAYIFVAISFLFYQKFKNELKKFNSFKIFILIFFICLSSSLIVYLDQKLIFIPFILFISILFMKIEITIKYYFTILFSLFALPYIYLIYIWGAVIPQPAAEAREVGLAVHFFNPIYCLTIIAFYIFPFIFYKKEKIIFLLKKKFDRSLLTIIGLLSLYFFYTIYFNNIDNLTVDGKGYFFKLSYYFFENTLIKILFTYIALILSTIVIYIFFEDKKDLFLVLFFLVLSFFTYPFYQEYLDPLIYILIFTFFNIKLNFSNKNIYFLFFYFLFFSLGAKFYYLII